MTETIRLAQVGIGYWGKNLLRNFAAIDGVEIAMACDQRESILAGVANQFPGVQTTSIYEDLLGSPDVDAIVIATETPQHAPLAEQALRAGKHVFVEKPMAQTSDDARTLVQLAADRDLRLMVGHLLLYHPAFRFVEDLVRGGGLGDVYYLYSQRVNLGIVRKQENAFESLAPHDISLALQFIDAAPVGVSANGAAYLQPGVQDVVFATIHFEGGKMANLHTSWLDPHKIRKVTVVGSRKMAVIDDVAASEKVRLYDKGVDVSRAGYADYVEAMTLRSGDINIPKITMTEPLRMECEHFVDCVRRGATPRSDGQNGLAVVEIMEAANKSLATGGILVPIRSGTD
ncbi:MAG: Gfo/Idh/MocA family oxidoreductase [Rhodothermales bacterium]|nr:Gfo/Idh/MocA family oxidoreductase [Rhodothermales bacterium]